MNPTIPIYFINRGNRVNERIVRGENISRRLANEMIDDAIEAGVDVEDCIGYTRLIHARHNVDGRPWRWTEVYI